MDPLSPSSAGSPQALAGVHGEAPWSPASEDLSALLQRPLSEVLDDAAACAAMRQDWARMKAELLDAQAARDELAQALETERAVRRRLQAELGGNPRGHEAHVLGLPEHLWLNALGLLDVEDLCAASVCCRGMRCLAHREQLWWALCARTWPVAALENCQNFRFALISSRAATRIAHVKHATELRTAAVDGLQAELDVLRADLVLRQLREPKCKTVTWKIEASAFQEGLFAGDMVMSPPLVAHQQATNWRMVLNTAPTRQQFGLQMPRGTSISGRVFFNGALALNIQYTWSRKVKEVMKMWGLDMYIDTASPLLVQVDFDTIQNADTLHLAHLTSG